jgi:hypothetical protein
MIIHNICVYSSHNSILYFKVIFKYFDIIIIIIIIIIIMLL